MHNRALDIDGAGRGAKDSPGTVCLLVFSFFLGVLREKSGGGAAVYVCVWGGIHVLTDMKKRCHSSSPDCTKRVFHDRIANQCQEAG